MPFSALPEYRSQAKYTDYKGHQLAYWSDGQGDVLVLIHGFPSASWDWHKIWPQLVGGHRVLAMDMLGYGLSDKPHPHRYSLLEQADILTHWLAQQGVTRCHLLAHDYGNSVAQELLKRHHQGRLDFSIQSLCFLNGGLFSETHRPLMTQKLLKGPLGGLVSRLMSKRSLNKSFTKIFGRSTPPSATEIDVLWTLLCEKQGMRVMPAMLQYIDERKVHRDEWVNGMQSTSVPQAFINGVQDPISGEHMLQRFRELLPDSNAYALDVGHYPQIEAPQQVLENYLAFRHSIEG